MRGRSQREARAPAASAGSRRTWLNSLIIKAADKDAPPRQRRPPALPLAPDTRVHTQFRRPAAGPAAPTPTIPVRPPIGRQIVN